MGVSFKHVLISFLMRYTALFNRYRAFFLTDIESCLFNKSNSYHNGYLLFSISIVLSSPGMGHSNGYRLLPLTGIGLFFKSYRDLFSTGIGLSLQQVSGSFFSTGIGFFFFQQVLGFFFSTGIGISLQQAPDFLSQIP